MSDEFISAAYRREFVKQMAKGPVKPVPFNIRRGPTGCAIVSITLSPDAI